MIRELIIVGSILLILGGICGYFLHPLINDPLAPRNVERFKEEINKRSPSLLVSPVITGRVVDVGSEEITIDVAVYSPISFSGKNGDLRKVRVKQNTTIIAIVPKPENLLATEISEFHERINRSVSLEGISVVPPLPYEERTVSISEISNGSLVVVTASPGVLLMRSFEAQKIEITNQ